MKLAPEVKKLKDHLPYHLTDAQEKVLNEVEWDLGSGLVMNRLSRVMSVPVRRLLLSWLCFMLHIMASRGR